MSKTLRIRPTVDEIAEANFASNLTCALALAIKHRFPGTFVSVGMDKCCIGDSRYAISKKGYRFILENIHRHHAGMEPTEPVTVILTPIERG